MKKKYITKIIVKYLYLLIIEAMLAVLVSYMIVKGNNIISSVIDEMLLGKDIVYREFVVRFLVYTIVGAVAAFVQKYVAGKFAILVCTEYRNVVVDNLYKKEYKYFDTNNSATILNKVIGDLGEINELLEHVLPLIVDSTISLVIYSAYIGVINLKLLILMLISYPIIFWMAGILVKQFRKLQGIYRQKTDAMAEIAQNAVSGILILRSFGLEEIFRAKMQKASRELVENEQKRTQITNTTLIVRKIIQWMPNIICAVYAVVLTSRGEISLGGLMAFILILNMFVDAFIGIPFYFVDATAGGVSVNRIEEILSGDEEPSGKECVPLSDDVIISFSELEFGYDSKCKVLDKLTFEIKKGESVAIVGPSGQGKSTVFHIICGFYQKNSGSLKILGRDIEEWNLLKLRENIALVSQNVFLFPATIKENVAYGKIDATEEEIINACKKAEIHEFIMSLPDGYNTVVGERGAMLSGGQKQRLSIARAILKDAPVLLFDEPTSALDVETESNIQKAIDNVMENKTCITIAHRLSTIVNSDRILVLNNGRIVESGTHDELMASGSFYANMYGEDK